MTDQDTVATSGVEIGIERVKEMIPHRDPFLMIDKVVDTVANERATGISRGARSTRILFPRDTFRPGR